MFIFSVLSFMSIKPRSSSRISSGLVLMVSVVSTGQHPDINSEEVHVVASLLKQYLRELPEPLLTFSNFHACMEIAKSCAGEKERG